MLRRTLVFTFATMTILGSDSVQANIIPFGGGSIGGLEVTTTDMSGGYVLADGSILPGTEANGALFSSAGVSVYRIWVHVDNAMGVVASAGGSAVQGLNLLILSGKGSFINSAIGGDGPPSAALMSLPGNESLLWDSFITIGGATDTTMPSGFTINDAGGILGGLQGNILGQDINWSVTPTPGAGVVSDGAGGWRVLLAQLVISPEEWMGARMRITGGGDDFYYSTGKIPPDVPAPSVLVFLGLAVLVGERRRRL